MTSKEFVQWLKGFTEGVHEYAITPKQWDLLKERLNEVSDEPKIVYPFGTPNGTGSPGFAVTTTPGTGYITVSNPNLFPNSFTTSTATSLPSGSAISYTNSTDKTLLND